MESTIEQIWYGNIFPSENHSIGNEEIKKLVRQMATTEEALLAALCETHKSTFIQYVDHAGQYACCISAKAFREGFCLAAKLLVEALMTS